MKELSKDKQREIIEEARKRFSYCLDYYSHSRNLSDDDEKFSFGDGDNLFQWVDQSTDYQQLVSNRKSGDVYLTINIAAQHKNQVVNAFKQGKPTGRIVSKGSGATAKSAKVMEGLIRHIKVSNNTDDKVAKAYDDCVDSGEGYVWWRTDYESNESFNLVLKSANVHRNCVFVDPNATEPDRSDADYGFIFKEVTKESLERQHKIDSAKSWSVDNVFVKEKNALVAVYYWCDYTKDVLEQYEDGSIGYRSDNKGLRAVNSRNVQRKTWYWAKIIGGHDELIDYDEWLGSMLPIVSLRGVEKTIDGQYVCKGKTRDIKDNNKIVNFAMSSAVEALASQPKAPYLVPVEMLNQLPANLKHLWDNPNKSRVPYLPWVSVDPQTGEQLQQPTREQPAFNPSAHINMMQIAMDNINVASGLHESNFGQEAPQKSGVAIQRQSARGETSNYHFVDNAQIALKYQERILLELVPKIYTFDQVVRIVDFQGKEHEVYIDPQLDEASIENPKPKEGDKEFLENVKYAFNPSFGKYDVEVDIGMSWPTQREETNVMLREFTQANPSYMQNFGDFMFMTLDTMYSDDMAERARKLLPPQLQDEKEGGEEIPPQVKSQMQEMQNALEGASQHVQQLESEANEAKKKADSLEAQNNILKVKEQELQSMLRLQKATQQAVPEKEPDDYDDMHANHDQLEYLLSELSIKVDRLASAMPMQEQVMQEPIAQAMPEPQEPMVQDENI